MSSSGFLDVNGTSFYYEVTGTGEPLLLIHGFNLDTRLWEDQVEEFSQNLRSLTVWCYSSLNSSPNFESKTPR
jgi:pimeloyl-ACP methyl ester carboxylesterase